ncbi:hypothetical protein [Paucibacter sp. B51]|uniref:hypothetical protein n=1 Tax=Paucibacter sp. B51 TaxID=2993315 RepID=UPI0022EC09D8|nr:hypothetical protein [Paucibacter sp. B51]
MPSETHKLTSEERFRQAFERLKTGTPDLLPKGTPISQNNIAKEAGCDPSALRKSRFPSLVREIQAYVEVHSHERLSQQAINLKQKKFRSEAKERLLEVIAQRDYAQSQLTSAFRRIVELSAEVKLLRIRLDEVSPPPTQLNRRTRT